MQPGQNVLETLLSDDLCALVTPGLSNDTSLLEAYHIRLITKISDELEDRGDLIADQERAFTIYSAIFPDDMDRYDAPELLATKVPHAILSPENKVVLSPGHKYGSEQKVLLCLLGCAIQQRLTARWGNDVQDFLDNGGYSKVLEKLIAVAAKIRIDEEELSFLRNSQEKSKRSNGL